MESQPATQGRVDVSDCCPPFDPAQFHDKELVWSDKPFVIDEVHSFFSVPIDLKAKLIRNEQLIKLAKAQTDQPLMLAHKVSPWRSELLLGATATVPGTRMTKVSGRFLTRVYDAPYDDTPRWIEDLRAFAASKGQTLETIYVGYTTCPNCSWKQDVKKVVLFGKITESAQA